MSKFVLLTLVAALATLTTTFTMVSTARADVVSTTLDCSSLNDAYVECDTGSVFTQAVLLSEDVAGSCVYGSTWGTYDRFVWVNHGCSGRFTVSGQNSTPIPVPQPQQPVSSRVDCRFNSVNWQPYYRATNHFVGRPNFGYADANQCAAAVQMGRSNAVCNWTGNGFTAYDIESNAQLFFDAYPTVDQCYAAIQ